MFLFALSGLALTLLVLGWDAIDVSTAVPAALIVYGIIGFALLIVACCTLVRYL
jgi:hypothetical protein